MYNREDIITAGSDLVGWSESNSQVYDNMPAELKSPKTSYYINELPGITVDLLNYAAQEKSVADYIELVHKSELIKVIDAFLLKQKDIVASKELLQNNTLIQTFNEYKQIISKSGRFVGYAIIPRESNSIKTTIQQIGIISSEQESFTLYLYESCKKTALYTKQITYTTPGSIQWFSLNWDIYFDREDGGAGERYIIGYYEDDISGDMYEDYWTGMTKHVAQKIFGQFVIVSPVRFSQGTLNGVDCPTMQYLHSSMNCKTSGFNLRFNTKCDITKVLRDNIHMFAEAVQYKIAVRILSDAMNGLDLNPAVNSQQNRTKWNELITQYNGELKGGITEAGIPVKGLIDRLSIDFSNLDPVCLKSLANRIGGVKW